MLKNIKLGLPVVVFLLVCGFLFRGLRLHPSELPSVLIGKPIPAFQSEPIASAIPTFSKQSLLGHVTLLTVWASWCQSCQQEQGFLMTKKSSSEFQWFGIDYKDADNDGLKFLQEYGNPFQAIIVDRDGKLGMDLGVYGTPETFILDKQAVIRFRYAGALNAAVWKSIILPEINRWEGA